MFISKRIVSDRVSCVDHRLQIILNIPNQCFDRVHASPIDEGEYIRICNCPKYRAWRWLAIFRLIPGETECEEEIRGVCIFSLSIIAIPHRGVRLNMYFIESESLSIFCTWKQSPLLDQKHSQIFEGNIEVDSPHPWCCCWCCYC